MSRFLRCLMMFLFFAAPAFGATHSVDVGPGLSFNPAAITVAAGDIVTWNFVAPNHTTTSNATTGVDAWDSGVVSPGGSFSHTFVNAGDHPYYCAIHSFPGGTMMNGVVTVTAPPPAPVLTAVSPTSGSTAGGLATTLTGTDFVADCVASFGGVNSPLTTFTNPATLQATTPAHTAGTVNVQLTCSNGSSTLAAAFTYNAPTAPPPVLTSVFPTSGSTAGGLATTLTGTDFVADCVASFGGVNAPLTTFTSPTTLQATTPGHGPGTVDVQVSCSTGTSVLPAAFTYLGASPTPPPSIPTLSPWVVVLLAAALLVVGLWMRS